jgi:hypothetical protein
LTTTSDSDRKASDESSDPATTAIADNIEPIAKDEEVSLDGFGNASITSTSIDEDEEEDDNAYFRDQKISDANKKCTPRKSNQQENKCSELELELTPQLKQAGIVNRFAYYRKTNAIQVLLNHHYDSKSIVFSVDKRNWNKTHSIFERQLKQKGISKEHILQLLDVLDNNYNTILSLGDDGLDPKSDSNNKIHQHQQQEQQKTSIIAAAEALLAEDDEEENDEQQVKEAVIIDPSKDLDPYISGIHYTEFVIKAIKRNVKQEDSLVRLLVYAGLTAYSYNPLCIGVRAPTTEGKTYAVIQSILKYFPKNDYVLIGSISPKALIRQHGILVDKDNYQPLEPKIRELKKEIRESKIDDEKEELQEQLSQLYKDAKYLIDISGKILLFLESPHPDVWEIIKTTLSHDAWEIEHPYVDTDLKTKNIVTRGWPACIFCSAKDESKWDIWPEIKSRFLIISPNMSQEKYLESNILTFQKLGLPNFVQQKIIVSDDDVELARKCILYLKEQIKSLCPIRYDASPRNEFKPTNPVWIPYQQYLAEALPSNRGPTMRTANQVGSLLDTVALTNSNFMVDYGNIGEKQVIARPEDLAEVIRITNNMTNSDYSGVSSNKVSFVKEIFIPTYTSKTEADSKGDKEEKIKAVTTKELCDYYKKQRKRGITTDNLKKQFLNELLANDIIGEIKSEIDGRQHIYYPLVDLEYEEEEDSKQQKQKITKLSNMLSFDNFLHCPQIKVPRNYKDVPENWLIYEILTLAKYRIDISDDNSSVTDVFDQGEQLKFLQKSNGSGNGNTTRLTIKEFVSKYEYSTDPGMSIRYILKGDFYEFHSEIFGNMIGICLLDHKDSKKLSNSSSFDNLVINGNGSSSDSIEPLNAVAIRNVLYHQQVIQKQTQVTDLLDQGSPKRDHDLYWTRGKWRDYLQQQE